MPDQSTVHNEHNTPANGIWIALPTRADEFPEFTAAVHTALASARGQAEHGQVLHYPCLTVQDLSQPEARVKAWERALDTLPQAGTGAADAIWVLLASAAAAQAFGDLLNALDASRMADLADRLQVAAIGKASQLAAAAFSADVGGIRDLTTLQAVDTDETGADESVLTSIIPPQTPILLPVAEEAHEPLVAELTRLGHAVTTVPLYRRFLGTSGDPVGQYLFEGRIDYVIFPSPEHLRFFRRRLLSEGGVLSMLDHVHVLCWDAWTASVARQFGLAVRALVDPGDATSIRRAIAD